jgi:hypothetical protein
MKLTDAQIASIQRGFYRGYPDTIIARELEIPHEKVYRFRVKSEISRDWIVERRYGWWERLFKQGTPLEVIAEIYGVSRQTVYVMLNRRGVSAREVKRELDQKRVRLGKKLKGLAQGGKNAGPMDW